MVKGAIRRHYEKVIAACCFLILFVNVGLPSTSFSVFQPYLVALPGVGNTGGSIIISVRTFMSLIAMLVVGRYYELLNCRLGAFVASACVAIGFFLYSQSTGSFAGLCAGSVFTGLGYGFGGMIASTMLINRWFRSNVATVAGIAAVGSGVAAVILPNVTVALISSNSLSAAFLFESVLAIAIGALVFLLLRNYPREMGLEPYEAAGKGKAKGASSSRGARRNRNVPARLFPLVLVAMVFVGCISVGGTSYLAVLFTSEGFSAEGAAALVALSGGCLTVAKLASGFVFDRVGTKRGSILFFALFIAGTALLCLSDMGNAQVAGVGVFLYGLGLSLGTVGISVWSIELAPRGREVKTIKNFQLCYALGGFIFTFLPGFLAEMFGTYLITYVILLGMISFAAVVVAGVYFLGDRTSPESAQAR